MTKFPTDDDRLVDFLRQHAGDVPPAAANLEQQIMQAVASSPQRAVKRRQLWVVPPAIAAGLLIVWTGYRILLPTISSNAELANLQAFMENNWDGVLSSNELGESFPLGSPTNN